MSILNGIDLAAPRITDTTMASAAIVDLGASDTRSVVITGTAAITSFGSARSCERALRFTGALALTHNATSLILPIGASITTAAGDTATAISDGAGNWRVRNYQRASGKALTGASVFRKRATLIANGTAAVDIKVPALAAYGQQEPILVRIAKCGFSDSDAYAQFGEYLVWVGNNGTNNLAYRSLLKSFANNMAFGFDPTAVTVSMVDAGTLRISIPGGASAGQGGLSTDVFVAASRMGIGLDALADVTSLVI